MHAQAPAPGFRLYGTMDSNDTHLVDTSGTIVHTWPSQFPPGFGVRLLADGSLLRAIGESCIPVGGGCGGGVQRMAFDGTLLWDFRYNGTGVLCHHDLEPLPNGNVLLMAWEEKTLAQATAYGRSPALIAGSVFRPDHIIEVHPTGPTSGAIVWEWHVVDHVIQDADPALPNYGNVRAHPELVDINYPPDAATADDWNHMNGIDYDPVHDWIVLSPRTQSEIWIIDHSTTTAEAASHSGGRWGHGGDLLYRWGNPAAHRAGGVNDQQLVHQHAPTFVPQGYPGAGNVVIFNNGFATNASAVFEIELPLDASDQFIVGPSGRFGPQAPVWTYVAPGFASALISSAQRLPNGNTLVCSGLQRWLFEVTPSGTLAWEYHPRGGNVFHVQYTERTLWTDRAELSAASGGRIGFDLVTGSARGAEAYLLLGSMSGTTPGIPLGDGVLPLNPDAFFYISAVYADQKPYFEDTLGRLNAIGAAHAFIDVPTRALLLSQPLPLHFAALVWDPFAVHEALASNAVPVLIRP